jgi:biotin transport system permease protein
MPAGPKLLLFVVGALGISLLPSLWWAGCAALGAVVLAYGLAGFRDGLLGLRVFAQQVWAVWWVVLVTAVAQLVLVGLEPAVANTARITAAIVFAGLLMLTTRVTDLLDALERGLAPFARLGARPDRVALMLTVTLSTVTVLGRLAHDVRDAQRARGARSSLKAFVVPFLVVALKHADDLGDALNARGVR